VLRELGELREGETVGGFITSCRVAAVSQEGSFRHLPLDSFPAPRIPWHNTRVRLHVYENIFRVEGFETGVIQQ